MAVYVEWFNLFVRWLHVIAAIMWIGDSFLFMWLDSHLSKPTKEREGTVVGELWMTHSGGFYEVVKRKSLDALPPSLYWFKWESYTTWLSGFLLLGIVYHHGAAAFLIDQSVAQLSVGQAIAISLGFVLGGYLLYELLWLTPLSKSQPAFAVVGFTVIVGAAYALTHLFSGRAAFLHVGAMIGTLMSANVFFRIIPAQKHMIAATKAGTPVDTSYGLRAKGRSIQNHYLTLPVLFTMLSNHFPSTYGHPLAWLVLASLVLFGAALKYVMNFRRQSHPLAFTMLACSFMGFAYLTAPKAEPLPGLSKYDGAKKVSFASVERVVQTRCVSCHARTPTTSMFAAPPQGIVFESPNDFKVRAPRMYLQAVASKAMPLGNITGMTQEERDVVGAWVAQGADITASGPAEVPVVDAGQAAIQQSPQLAAKEIFESRCVACHGANGDGLGAASLSFPVKPRNFHDSAWQQATTDDAIVTIIVQGGAAVGKSALMPPNPDLMPSSEVTKELLKTVRSFGGAPTP